MAVRMPLCSALNLFMLTPIAANSSRRTMPVQLARSATLRASFGTVRQTNLNRRLVAAKLQYSRTVCMAANINSVQPMEASGLLEAGYTYLDVRSEGEFQAGHVEGAINIPWMFMTPTGMDPNPDFLAQVAKEIPNKDSQVVLGCKSGKRSMMASCAMAEQGYSEIINMEGGFDMWQGTGLPSVK
eukprot:CAMPEP_0114251900 /NCGR_PEP_ID=MMETSP0058-20121206/15531_1 /TAXON_ID=36894 /ORGANISM="Pyramimonas parkeae, CCMP726" /LENGTH=184 /DNA_ID=CAMNT_0001365761 /DNA_START=79 /DNA_END=633 /DNA_ORIENTATION=+